MVQRTRKDCGILGGARLCDPVVGSDCLPLLAVLANG